MAAENAFLKLKRTEFQAWFGQIMEKAHPDEYENIRVTQGDGGLDGLLIRSAAVFQVYAPREQSASEIITKIDSDFATAKETMGERGAKLKRWIFVHNDEGLTKETGPKIVEIEQANSDVKIERWSFEGIWLEHEKLSVDQLTDMYGQGPTEENVDRLAFPAIRDVIGYLSRNNAPTNVDMVMPDPDKLEHNKLGPERADMLRVGRHRQGLVEQYLNGMTDPTTGEEIAQAFRDKYACLKASGMSAGQIFTSLWRFAGGEHFVQPDQNAAVTAVLAYYFSSCDIFENVPSDA
jgi:hypothetical protein